MSIWFEGHSEMTSVELIELGDKFVKIKTNEGIMRRTNINKRIEVERSVLEFDEAYQAGPVTANSHFHHEFAVSKAGVRHRLVISDVSAKGLLGFFYRKFGSRNIGKTFLKSYQDYFAKKNG